MRHESEAHEQREVPLQNVLRRLSRRVKKIEALHQEIDQLYDLISAPAPEEFEEMARGKRALTLEVLLLGVIGQCLYHLSESKAVIDHFRPYTPRSVGKGTHRFWRTELMNRIRQEVKWRAEGK